MIPHPGVSKECLSLLVLPSTNDRTGITSQTGLYSFETFIDELDGTSPNLLQMSQMDALASQPPASTTPPQARPASSNGHACILPGVSATVTSATEATEALEAEVLRLCVELQAMNSLRLMAEKRARMAENERGMWKGSYEELRKRVYGY